MRTGVFSSGYLCHPVTGGFSLVEAQAMSPARKEPDESTYSGRVAKRIRELREAKGLTGGDVADKLTLAGFPMTQGAYSHWETGRVKPQWDAIPSLAKILGVPIRLLIPER